MSVLHLDWETRSTVELPNTGAYVYAMHPDTDIWLGAWAFDDDEPELWHPGEPVPPRIVAHVAAGGEIRAHNAAFERVMWQYVATPRHGWPVARLEQFVCSAAEAAAMSLPRSLGECARVTGVTAQKDTEGHNLMMRMCRPRRVNPDGSLVWWDVPERVARLGAYCQQDLRTERALEKVLRRLTPDEREMYLLDQRINDRGVALDVELITAAQRIADEGVARANALMAELTSGEVTTITNHGRLRAWLAREGVETDSVGKPAVAAMMEGELPEHVREALQTRADAGRSSIAKLKRMLACACDDLRARGLYLYHAATTGRWGGRNIQAQNFPRGEVDDVESFIGDVLRGAYDRIDLIAHPVIVVLSMLRSMLVAGPGRELIAGDYSAIEARVLNWLAGQEDVLRSFREYDAGDKSKDPYKRMGVRMGRAASVELITKEDRQAGKAAELGCGFQMGWKKFISAAWAVYQVRVTEAQSRAAVDAYRSSHPMVVTLWNDTNAACMEAIEKPGVAVTFGGRRNLKVVVAGAYMYIVLPSGRPLCYPAPRIADGETPWGEVRPGVVYWAVDGKTNQWCQHRTYGGHLVENIVQAVARDLLADAMLRLERLKYLPVMHSHDEIVCENEYPESTQAEFERIMAQLPAWATDLPIAVESWRGQRYRK